MTRDTIFALASGRPPAAIAIVRISGPRAHAAAAALAADLPPPRSAAVRELRHPANGDLLDEALVLIFAGPASATGEDVAELHCHGGRAVVDAVLGALAAIDGLRPARPGEFTRRAFETGRIDLTEAEGLADLLEAETEAQRKAALALAEGGLRRQVEAWQARVLALSARAEASIDYAEDQDFGADLDLKRDCEALAEELRAWLARPRVEPLKDGIRVVVAGPPNAGKSSLVNAIAGEERAIVTDVPGTTRDHIEVPIALGGLPILLTDTAGLRESDEMVEQIGIGRARSLAARADILLWLGEAGDAAHPNLILVHPQCDRPERRQAPAGAIATSSVTEAGIDVLLREVEERARQLLPGEDALSLNRRQADHFAEAEGALARAGASVDSVLLAEDLRAARAAFDRVTGRAGMEDVLDALFGRFCLGK